jgi:hypothetical protein
MHPYSEKREIARQQIALKEFPKMHDAGGREWLGANYHVRYSDWFSGYFLYKISGVVGALESVEFLTGEKLITGYTWWGFHIQLANDEVHRNGFEQPLLAVEVTAWLARNYGHLAAADEYEYLFNALHDECVKHQLWGHHNVKQAMDWLKAKISSLSALSQSSINSQQAATVAPPAGSSPGARPDNSQQQAPASVDGPQGTQATESQLSPADLILGAKFTLEEADKLAKRIKLIDEQGRYHLGPRKLGAIVGFCSALKEHNRLVGNIPELTAVMAPRYGVEIRTRKSTSKISKHYFDRTEKAIFNLNPTD